MLYLLYPSVIVLIVFIVNKQTTSIPRTFEKLATPLAVWSVSIFVFFLFSRPFFWLQPAARPPVNMCRYRKQEVPCVWLFRHSAFVVAGSDSSCLGCIRATLSAVLPCQGWPSPAMWPSWQSALSQTMSSVRKIWARHKPRAQRILHYPL